MDERAEYASETVSIETLRAMLPKVEEFLSSVKAGLTVEFGWGCGLPTPELWRPAALHPGELGALLAEAESRGVFRLGQGDLIVRAADNSFDLTLCHESDVHLVSSDPVVVEWFAGLLRRHQLRGFYKEAADSRQSWEDWH